MIGIGFIVSTWVSYGSSKVPKTSSFSWRFPLGFQCVPCIIIIAGILFFPESPRYLVETDRQEEALRVLKKLHYNGSNMDWVQSEFNEIKLTIEAEKAITAPGWLIMFKVPAWRKRLMHATLAQVFTQMTGFVNPSPCGPLMIRMANNWYSINVIGYYSTILYKNLGIVGDRNLLVSSIYNVVGPVFNLIFITLFLDRVGRKKPLIFGCIGISIALICEAVIGSQVTHATGARRDSLSIAGVFFLFAVSAMFSMSFGPISWVYASGMWNLGWAEGIMS
jgi:MFS family permease